VTTTGARSRQSIERKGRHMVAKKIKAKGKTTAKARGKRPRITDATRRAVLADLKKGLTQLGVAKKHGIGQASVSGIKNAGGATAA
jgi:hypothetical protein